MNLSKHYSLSNKTFVKALILTSIMCFNAACSNERKAESPKQTSELIAAPADLKVGEGFKSSIGYYESEPRFSWQIGETAHSNFQSAYQVQVEIGRASCRERVFSSV